MEDAKLIKLHETLQKLQPRGKVSQWLPPCP